MSFKSYKTKIKYQALKFDGENDKQFKDYFNSEYWWEKKYNIEIRDEKLFIIVTEKAYVLEKYDWLVVEFSADWGESKVCVKKEFEFWEEFELDE